jgi:heme-degrading monooxygenase HmoA
MITVGMNYEVIEGKEDVFERHFGNVVNAMNAVAGHRETFLYKQVGSPRTYLIMSAWDERAAFDAFVRSDAFKRVTTWGLSGILAGRPRHEVYGADALTHAPEGCRRPVAPEALA